MVLALRMFSHVLDDTRHRHSRVEALATIVMWFAAGAFVTSTIGALVADPDPSQLVDLAGGVAAAILALICKAA